MPKSIFHLPRFYSRGLTLKTDADKLKVRRTVNEAWANASIEAKDILAGSDASWAFEILMDSAVQPVHKLFHALKHLEVAELEAARVAAIKSDLYLEWIGHDLGKPGQTASVLEHSLHQALESELTLNFIDWGHRHTVVKAIQALQVIERDFAPVANTNPQSFGRKRKTRAQIDRADADRQRTIATRGKAGQKPPKGKRA